jgi:hypothetical protein
MNNKLYDRLKFVAQIFLPALGTLYFALAGIWGFPNADEVVGTIVAVDTFLGVVLQISSTQYGNNPDGTIDVVEEGRQALVYSLNLNGDPEELQNQDQVRFKVNSPPSS